MKIFKNRQSAGKILAKHLKDKGADLVLAIPRGGVMVAHEVAKELKLPLDIIVTRKIGAPMQPELALGAVDRDGEVVWDENLKQELRIKNYELREELERQKQEIIRREKVYRQGRKSLNVENKTVILTDDGIATGATALAAINYLKRHEVKKIVLAVPVASKESAEKLKSEVDELIILETPRLFRAVGEFYQEFTEVRDEEVIQLLSSRT
ncbi:MAG: phosphoribosyltransferase family protein [Candidatus Daviesbacteria bacterium]|nr:phosphoribosyltransferase family protein [Candidatus Daviesbacteria bacterium]